MNDIDIDIHSIAPDHFRKCRLVDIREPNEIEAWPAETMNVDIVPLSQIQEKLDYFKKGEEYLLFCAKGGRSHYLAEVLNDQGFKAYSINNGIASVNAYLSKLDANRS